MPEVAGVISWRPPMKYRSAATTSFAYDGRWMTRTPPTSYEIVRLSIETTRPVGVVTEIASVGRADAHETAPAKAHSTAASRTIATGRTAGLGFGVTATTTCLPLQ